MKLSSKAYTLLLVGARQGFQSVSFVDAATTSSPTITPTVAFNHIGTGFCADSMNSLYPIDAYKSNVGSTPEDCSAWCQENHNANLLGFSYSMTNEECYCELDNLGQGPIGGTVVFGGNEPFGCYVYPISSPTTMPTAPTNSPTITPTIYPITPTVNFNFIGAGFCADSMNSLYPVDAYKSNVGSTPEDCSAWCQENHNANLLGFSYSMTNEECYCERDNFGQGPIRETTAFGGNEPFGCYVYSTLSPTTMPTAPTNSPTITPTIYPIPSPTTMPTAPTNSPTITPTINFNFIGAGFCADSMNSLYPADAYKSNVGSTPEDCSAWCQQNNNANLLGFSYSMTNEECYCESDNFGQGPIRGTVVFGGNEPFGCYVYSTLSPTTTHATTSPSSQPTTISPTSQPTSLTCYNARKIRLESTTGAHIQIFELEALSSNVNVALQGTATQSSDWGSKFVASNAIDGNENTFSHTRHSNAWIEIDLGESHLIDEVVIKNRWCGDESDGPACLCRLSSAKILLLDDNGLIIAEKNLEDTCGVLTVSESYTSDAGC